MFKLSSTKLSNNAQRIRLGLLGLSCSPIIGSYFYNQGHRLPFLVCPLKYWTGIPCPTCGITRSFMAVSQGDLSQAIAHHLFGPLLFASCIIATIHITLELLTKHRIAAFYTQLLRQKKLQHLSLIMLISYHALRLYYLSKSGELSFAFEQSPLGEWIFSRTKAS
jgi:hypothetical protein